MQETKEKRFFDKNQNSLEDTDEDVKKLEAEFQKLKSEWAEDRKRLIDLYEKLLQEEKDAEENNLKQKTQQNESIGTEKNESAEITDEKLKEFINKAEQDLEAEEEEIIVESINDNEETIEEELVDKPAQERTKWAITKLIQKFWKNKFIKYVVLPGSLAVSAVMAYYTPKGCWEMAKNWSERNLLKDGEDDPSIKGITDVYNDSSSAERATYDFLGKDKIDYKFGYYKTSVFDLSDRTAPRFELINGRYDHEQIDSAAGITTNLFKRFQKYNDFKPELKGHVGVKAEKLTDIPVIAFNTETKKMRAGHYGDFGEQWLVSETYQIPLNFKLNSDHTINLVYHDQAMRMVPQTTNENGKQIPFPIGVVVDKNIKKINPEKCTHLGTLEGGKVIMVCGEKQLQVNGSFADMFMVYQRLCKENPDQTITAYLLDNGSYNLPIWDKDEKLTSEEITQHLFRNRDGGTALVLIDDGAVSPYEYKNKYKEVHHQTKNFARNKETGSPIINEKNVIVIHHTGNYDDPNKIVKEFEGEAETSAHVLIMKDGTRHLFNNDNYVLAHAGKSDFNNRNAVNYFSIGIEIEGDTKHGHQFTVAQLESMLEFIRPRVEKYGIPFENITTHKIIRDNYIKKHPNEKTAGKEDLNDKVWEEIQNLINKKLYQKENTTTSIKKMKLSSAFIFEDIYKKTGNREKALLEVSNFLKSNLVPKDTRLEILNAFV